MKSFLYFCLGGVLVSFIVSVPYFVILEISQYWFCHLYGEANLLDTWYMLAGNCYVEIEGSWVKQINHEQIIMESLK